MTDAREGIDLTTPKYLDRRLLEAAAREMARHAQADSSWRRFLPEARHALFLEQNGVKGPPPPRVRLRR